MKKTNLHKLIKLSFFGILILIVLVVLLSRLSRKGATSKVNDMESTTLNNIMLNDNESEENLEKDASTMVDDTDAESSQSAEMKYTGIQISPVKQQTIGVKTEEVVVRTLVRNIRTVGIIEADERKIARVSIKFSGWIKDVFIDYIGKFVRRGEPLFTVYSPKLVSTEEEYLLALRAQESFGKSAFPEISSSAKSLLEATRNRLLLLDIPEEEVQRIEKTGMSLKYLTLYSPITGYVTKREAFPEKMIMPNDIVFEIVDLSEVWVLADIYEYELPLVTEGKEAALTLSYYPEEVFHGKVTYVYPTLETKTRTIKVRFEFENEDTKLKPGMYANVELTIPFGERLSVSEDSVIDTGMNKIVFVAMGDGYFDPREVKVGRKAEGYFEVIDGLKEGDRVVTSAAFLIDSESRLKAAIEGFGSGMPGQGGTDVSDVQKATTKEINISFSNDSGSRKKGKNLFKTILTDIDGNPLENANVNVIFHMPPMQAMGMPAMTISSEGKHTKDGIYIVNTELPMSGSWQIKVTATSPGKKSVFSYAEIVVR